MMGNRGVLHDADRRIVRSSQVRRWIACVLEFRGRHRRVMAPNRYTELFFLDEATAFGAGHRPCAECRHADYQRYRSLWERWSGASANADLMDATLHADRIAGGRPNLPDGTYIAIDEKAWLVWGSALFAWSDSGYVSRRPRPIRDEVEVLTPRASVAVLTLGYRPAIHPTAE
jgi:hypothetical protein